MNQLIERTNQLLTNLDELFDVFNDEQEPSKDKAFFHYVERETTPIFETIEEWEELAEQAIRQNKVTLQQAQITSTKDSLKALILHSYYKDVRRRRYMDINKS